MEKKNPIDRIIKEKLEGLEAPFNADAWQLMEQKLDDEAMGPVGQPAADAKHIDEAVFEKIHRYRAPHQPAHWRRMEALLDEAFAWPRKVLRYKLTELALMLLLFLFLWQYIPSGPDTAPRYRQAIENTIPNMPLAKESAPTRPDAQKHIQTGHAPGPQKGIPAESSLPAAAAGHEGGIAPPGEEAPSADAPLSTKFIPIADNDAHEKAAHFFSPPAPLERRNSVPKSPARPLPVWPAFQPGLGWLEILSPELAYEPDRDIGEATAKRNKGGAVFRVGMFGSTEYNHITVPSSGEKKLEEELQRYAIGYGGGLSLGLEIGRFEIEAGAIYAARQYPVGLVYVNGSVGSGLQGQRLEASELNIINVPLHFRYSFIRRGAWRGYALAGASLQVAFQRNYYVTEEPTYDFLPMQPPAPAPTPGDEPAIDRIRKSGLGWFEGGTFEENAYLTGNLGLGLERYINPRWSLFVQPTYQHSLQYFRVGLGPNADRINSLSVLFGAKVRLK